MPASPTSDGVAPTPKQTGRVQTTPSSEGGTNRTADRPDVSIIIVNYNVREFLDQSLRSIRRASEGLDTEIFVVDNNSADGSVERVEEEFPEVNLIANRSNRGFSRANNQALRQARGRYLLILNPDTLVQEDTIRTLVDYMDRRPDTGAAGPQIMNPDGTFAPESRRAFPTPATALYRLLGLSRLFPDSERFGRYNMTYLPKDEEAEIDALSGSCMIVRHAALYCSRKEAETCFSDRSEEEIPIDELRELGDEGAGLLDEDYFMYGEDLDWCYRIQQAGWAIRYTPETQIIHYKGKSTSKRDLEYVRLFYRAMLLFARKHFSDRYSGLYSFLIRIGIVLHGAFALARGTVQRMALPLTDFALAYSAVGGATLWRQVATGVTPPPYFYSLVAPLYALTAVLGVAATDTYRRGRIHSMKDIAVGVGGAFVGVTILSFYIRSIAYSRLVPLVGFTTIGILLVGLRWAIRRGREYFRGQRRAVLVGHPAEAERLHNLLVKHPDPDFDLIGYVDDENENAIQSGPSSDRVELPRLGYVRQLADLIRLRGVDDVIFATNGLSNRLMFRLMHRLRTLPVQFRILGERQEQLIGKASIDDLNPARLDRPSERIGPLRGSLSRRLYEIPLAVIGLLAYPLLHLARSLSGHPHRALDRALERTERLGDVLTGRRALVGVHPAHRRLVPDAWDLPEGVFCVVDALDVEPEERTELHRAYWFYARNQSAQLDVTIVYRALTRTESRS